jgi:hypothetical protein
LETTLKRTTKHSGERKTRSKPEMEEAKMGCDQFERANATPDGWDAMRIFWEAAVDRLKSFVERSPPKPQSNAGRPPTSTKRSEKDQ